jgi:hypothetical protein
LKGDALDHPIEQKDALIGVCACHRRDRIAADFAGLQLDAAETDALDLACASDRRALIPPDVLAFAKRVSEGSPGDFAAAYRCRWQSA